MRIKNYNKLGAEISFCADCRAPNDGTVRLAHRNVNIWGVAFGRGIKSLSLSGAFLCHNCDQFYSEGDGRKDSHFWELACQRSQNFAWQSGHLTFNPDGGDPDSRLR